MKLLLTSSGISNASIESSLVYLLGKSISECNALFVPTAIYPFAGSPYMAYQAISGGAHASLSQLGWKSLGLLELTALPSIEQSAWLPSVKEADALLVWGGDPLYLAHWMQQSGLAEQLPALNECVYVGASAGSIATASVFGETYREPRQGTGTPLTSEDIEFESPQGPLSRTFVTARGLGLVDFAVIPHFDNDNHPDASMSIAGKWASMLPCPVYAIDDQTAVQINGETVEVVSEGSWKFFHPARPLRQT